MKQMPKYVPLILSGSVLAMIVSSLVNGWYTADGNLSGIWVEIHGIVIELLILVVIWNWYVSWKEKSEWSSVSGFAHAAIYNLLVRMVKIVCRDYYESEKKYLKFGTERVRICNISMTDIVKHDRATDDAMIEVRGGYQKAALELETEADKISHEINRLYVLYHGLLEPEPSFSMSRSINVLNEFREEVNQFIMVSADMSDAMIPDVYDEIVREKAKILLTFLVDTMHLIEKSADGTMSKEEKDQEQKEKHARAREIRSQRINGFKKLKSQFGI